MRFFRLDPITRKRLKRFRQLKRGYYSLLILVAATFLSIFAEYLANGKAVVVRYQGTYYFPTWKTYDMAKFGQEDVEGWGLDDLPADYRRLKDEWAALQDEYEKEIANFQGTDAERDALDEKYKDRHNWLILPPIPWGALENDLTYYQQKYSPEAIKAEFGTLEKPTETTLAAWKEREARWLAEKPESEPEEAWLAKSRKEWLEAKSAEWTRYSRPPHTLDWDRKHFLGTDSQGRDVASRLLYGFRISIFFALSLVVVGQILGTIVGSMQGYLAGWFDLLGQRFIEIWSTLPFLYIVMIFGSLSYLEEYRGFLMLLGIMALFQWINITWFMRTEMYREKTREYCLAAQSYGASHARIMFRHLLPNCLTPLVTFTPFAIVGAISALTGLDYLGYGLPAPTPSWGELIEQSQTPENRKAIWLTYAPFCAIVSTLTLVTFVGESVREAFDPRKYAKYK